LSDEWAGAAADEIRAAQVARLAQHIEIAPDLAPNEFTLRDANALWPGASENTIERNLKALVKAKVLESDTRIDSRTGRSALAYWFVE
jgi:hypothetical protein